MDANSRLWSLDALRGFDMFFITGGAACISGICAALGCGDGWLAQQMRHVPWAGLAQHDTIFPLFLFLAGVSWPFSYAAQLAKGCLSWQIHRKVLLRAAILFLFGLAGGLLKFSPPFRIPSVLGQIGVSWGVAALLFMHVRKPVWRGAVIAAILLGYWALLNFTIAPGAPVGADCYAKEFNVISWLDRTLMPNWIYQKGVYDPESLFAFPPGAALALLGMSAGALLRSDRWTGPRKVMFLFGSSVALLVAALFFIHVLKMPIVKALWTSSFVLAAAAYSSALLALFYWIVDVKGWRRWTTYLRIVGMNSITIYMLMQVGVVMAFHKYLFGGLVEWCGPTWSRAAWGITYHFAGWLILLFLYRRKIFLKV